MTLVLFNFDLLLGLEQQLQGLSMLLKSYDIIASHNHLVNIVPAPDLDKVQSEFQLRKLYHPADEKADALKQFLI